MNGFIIGLKPQSHITRLCISVEHLCAFKPFILVVLGSLTLQFWFSDRQMQYLPSTKWQAGKVSTLLVNIVLHQLKRRWWGPKMKLKRRMNDMLHVTHIDMKGLTCLCSVLLPRICGILHIIMFSIYMVRLKLRQCLQGTECSCMEFNCSISIDLNEYYSCLLPQHKHFCRNALCVWLQTYSGACFVSFHSYSLWYTASSKRGASHEQKV